MNFNKLASILAKLEGKKSQARIADIRELLKILVELDASLRMADDVSALGYLKERSDKVLAKKLKVKK